MTAVLFFATTVLIFVTTVLTKITTVLILKCPPKVFCLTVGGHFNSGAFLDYLIKSTLRFRNLSSASPFSMPFWSRARSMSWWTMELPFA